MKLHRPCATALCCAVVVLAVFACQGSEKSRATLGSDGMPIHLEEQLSLATVEGGEVPVDLAPPLTWDLGLSKPEWKPLPTFLPGARPAHLAVTDRGLRLRLEAANRSPGPGESGLYGGIYTELEDFNLEDWTHAIVELSIEGKVDDLGVGYNVRTQASDKPDDQWPTEFYSDGPHVKEGRQTISIPLNGRFAPGGGEPVHQISLEVSSDLPVTIDIHSIRLLPADAVYAAAGGVGVRSVSSSKHEDFGPQRRSIFAHAPADISFAVRVPPQGRLDLGLGSHGSSAHMAVEIRAKRDGVVRLLDEQVAAGEAWLQRSLDLSPWAGKEVTLTLITERVIADRNAVGLWTAPTVTSAAPQSANATYPNVIFYVIDGASAGSMSVYGYERPTTPNLERLAKEGVLFERAHSNATWTMPSTASFMTSLHHSVLGGLRDDANPIPPEATTMAEHFHRAGFHTGVFTMNPNAGGRSGLDRGVDVFRDFGKRGVDADPVEAISAQVLQAQYWAWRDAYPGTYWVHFQTTDVHPPHRPPAPFTGRLVAHERSQELSEQMMSMDFPFRHDSASVHEHFQKQLEKHGLDPATFYGTMRDVHDEAMMSQDHQLGLLVEDLKRRGEWENTLLIIASDHGHPAASYPRFGRGLLDPQPAAYEGALLGEFESHIPMIFIWPNRISGGGRIAEPVSMIDMLPTILDLVGLPKASVAQGASLAPLLLGKDGWQPKPVVFDEFRLTEDGELIGNLELLDGRWGHSLEIRTAELAQNPSLGRHPAPAGGRWKALEFKEVPRYLLYDVENDPLAVRHVNDQHPEMAPEASRRLLRLWKEHRELASQFTRGVEVALSPEQVKALQALGYIQ